MGRARRTGCAGGPWAWRGRWRVTLGGASEGAALKGRLNFLSAEHAVSGSMRAKSYISRPDPMSPCCVNKTSANKIISRILRHPKKFFISVIVNKG